MAVTWDVATGLRVGGEMVLTIPAGRRVRPLPDGDQYLGFIFAEAATRHEVEQALTAAACRLRVIIG